MSDLTDAELSEIAAFLHGQAVEVAGPLQADLIAGGRSNLTFRLTDGWSQWVLRMPPRVGRTPSAHDVAREYAMIRALRGSQVPVPPAIGLCEDESVVGSPFSVFGFVAGQTIRTRAALDALSGGTVAELTRRLIAVLAALHQVDYAAAGLQRFERPGSYAERQIRRWRGQWDIVATGQLRPLGERAASALAAHVPDQADNAIVHGDFRIDNTLVVLDSSGTASAGASSIADLPRVAAVLDWELGTIGDPVSDVAMMCAYRHEAFDLIVGEPSAWTSSRLPAADELAAAYEEARRRPLTAWDFQLALAYFKVAVIAAGIDHRYRAGAGTGAGYATAGQSVGAYLGLALQTLGSGVS